MVLALARPVARVVLLERTRKKAAFLVETAAALGLGAEVLAVHSPEYHPAEPFALVTARAAGPAEEVIQAAAHLVASGGTLALYQGPSLDARLGAVRAAGRARGLEVRKLAAFDLPHAGARRLLLMIK